MKVNTRSTIGWFCVAVLTIAGCSTGTEEPTGASVPEIKAGTANIAYTSEEQSATLAHLRAIRFNDLEGNSELRLFFSEDSMDGVVVADFFGEDQIRDWVMDGVKTMADVKPVLQLTSPYDDPEGSYNGFMHPGTSFSTSGESPYKEFALTADRVSGHLSIEAFGGTITLDGTFDAPVTEVQQVEPMVGAAIAESPQGKQVMKLMEALSTGKVEDLAKLVTAESFAEIKQYTEGMSPDDVKALTSGLRTEPEELLAQFADGRARLSVAGKSALLAVVEEGDGYTSTRQTRLEWTDGDWLVSF